MSKTDGLLLEKIEKLSFEKLERLLFLSVAFFSLSPVIIMPFNALGLDGYNVIGIWMVFLYLSGGLGLLFGGIYLFKMFSVRRRPGKRALSSMEPVLLLVCFFIWCLISIFFAEAKRVAVYGYGAYNDNLITYLFYGGMLINGIVLSRNSKYLIVLAKLFVSVSVLMSALALVNNESILKLLCSNSYTSNEAYRAVFLKADDFALYLVIAVLVSIVLFVSTKKTIDSIIWVVTAAVDYFVLVCIGKIWFIITPVAVLFLFVLFDRRKNESPTRKNFLIIILVLSTILFICTTILGTDLKMVSDYAAYSGPMIENPKDTLASIFTLWKKAIVSISEYPITGVGLQNSMFTSHNVFLQIGIYTGIIGLLLYISVYVVLGKIICFNFRTLPPTVRNSLLVVSGYLLSALMGVTVFTVASFFYFVLGIVLSICFEFVFNNKKEDNENRFVEDD